MEMVLFDIISILHGLIFPFVMNIETAFFSKTMTLFLGLSFCLLLTVIPTFERSRSQQSARI
jgi:hypothetical protein